MNPARSTPCSDCPWLRSSTRGWLGPLSAEEWLQLIVSDAPVACHQTIEISERWTERTLQCAGAASFRAHICKSPRDAQVARGPVDRERVFARADEFRAHHTSALADWLAAQREGEA